MAQKYSRRKRNGEQGVALVLLAIAILPLIGILSLAIDSFRLYVSNLEQESFAELAALSAIRAYHTAPTSLSVQQRQSRAYFEAIQVINRNVYSSSRESVTLGSSGRKGNEDQHISFGQWRPTRHCKSNLAGCFVAVSRATPPNAVRVRVTDTDESVLQSFAGSLFGLTSFSKKSAEAVAIYDWNSSQSSARSFRVVYSN